MEIYLDTVRVRVGEMQAHAKDAERRWNTAGIPWSDAAFKECRLVALHLATLFMSQYPPPLPINPPPPHWPLFLHNLRW